MSNHRLSLNESLWVCGGFIERANRHARAEIAALRERGAKVFILKSHDDREGIEELRRLLWQTDTHAILMWLHPREMAAIQPIFRERKNFSAVLDDWWIIPHWFIREAEYKIFRKYSGIAVRLGQSGFVCDAPPWLVGRVPFSKYAAMASLLRLPALAISPAVDLCKWFQRRGENIQPEKLLLFPFTVVAGSLPLKGEKIEYDFGVSGSTCGVWVMRDPFVSFKYTFANLYYDRQRLMDQIGKFEGNPFKVFDWRRVPGGTPPQSWDDYLHKTRQSRYVVSTGGLHDAAVPKYPEYACVGTPMIGRKLPFEYPWLDDCLFPVDIMRLTPEKLKPLLDEAIERYPVMRENCLKWRERLFGLYDVHRLLDMVQAQVDGKPIPPGYLTQKAENFRGQIGLKK
jgi:hypothetical protein